MENLRVILSTRPTLRALPHWSFLPLGMAMQSATDRRAGARVFTMVPGGATPEGALGYVSAGLELAMQVERGEAPVPRTVLVAVGSTCTSAGLLVGMRVAAELGIGWKRAPGLVSVRVTPWPVTSAYRIVGLAARTAALLASLTGEPRWRMSRQELAARLEVDGRYLGWGYGRATPEGLDALHRLRETEGLELDPTYSAKAVASALTRVRRGDPGPIVYWSTKSTAPLPVVTEEDWRWAPKKMVRFIERTEREHPKP
jgi:D-cysteine desulfhydrase